MLKSLNELLLPWVACDLPDVEIRALYNDSRQVKPGGVFLAYPGAATDGRLYVKQAADAGAVAIVYEPGNWPAHISLPDSCPCVALPDLAHHLAAIASRFYGEPTRNLSLTGITGTNGKTTIAYQLAQAHERLSSPAAYIGTLGYGPVSDLQLSANTTPDALCLQSLFYEYLNQGRCQVAMEVSSHALDQGRVDNIDFRQAIFTNLTLDHLDYHHSMEAYAAAKALLFQRRGLQWAIINEDDPYAPIMKAATAPGCQVMTYGIGAGCLVRALRWDVNMLGTSIDIESPWGAHQLRIRALGFFNIYNALAIFSSLMLHGYPVEDVIAVMAQLQPAPGRMDMVAQEPCMLVDYAHTPDALENVLQTLNKVKRKRLFVVFGCGGDRDKSKRPIMGDIASRHADVTIITSDNPRSEDPEQIIRDIEKGIVAHDHEVYRIADRKQAIARAIQLADKDDIVLVAGKGHEAYQQIGSIRHPFSDHEVITQLLNRSPD
ncbi:UDP-N-acetylmuramoyl-L-alanyl-D-glutamate--2,6-diaminopimelate ligase [Legionella sp. CNM-4043-24]|uniref:UDP-N-acetylmuramoyl-L-alanyl-D-glutamate--2, 6-diaminopimelate ligase n=1 Tax=Legionella sp. CNM-4043-24 TaxID=3421646 RepID=UPI00403AEBC7